MYKVYRTINSIITHFVKSPKIGGTSRPTVWFHLASLGEINSARALLDKFLKNGYFVFTTVFTNSGLMKLKELYEEGINFEVVRFPYDKPTFIEEVFKKKSVRALIIVETELWPNLITIASEHTNLYLVNARISDKNVKRLLKLRKFFGNLLLKFNLIFPVSTYQRERFKEFGVPDDKLVYFGNTKVDGLRVDTSKLIKRNEIDIPEDEFVVIFGSVRGGEIDSVVKISDALLKAGIGVMIAPRHLTKVGLLEEKLRERGIPYAKRRKEKYKKGRVYIIDTLGELKKFYFLSDVAFVGGTLEDYGGHNVLEPAVFGKPVLFGPYVDNIKDEAYGLLEAKGGFQVKNEEELKDKILELYKNRNMTLHTGKNALSFFEKLEKTSDNIYKRIIGDLNESKESI